MRSPGTRGRPAWQEITDTVVIQWYNSFPAAEINVFTQFGFVVRVGLACRMAILIVELAEQQRPEGKSITDATLRPSW